MFQLARPLFLTCETPLHAGSGDSLGIVDMPIQRERHTSFPKIEASSLKGALREAFEEKIGRSHADITKAFGPESDASDHAGALGFTDARLLLFPVKSMKGVFAWITCPKVLRQFSEDLSLALKWEVSDLPSASEGEAVPLGADTLSIGTSGNENFVLEEYTFKKGKMANSKITGKDLSVWLADNLFISGSYWHTKAQKDILVLSDDDFKDFVNLSTEVITRIKIDNETGTAQSGALFTEEYLPSEAVLYSLVLASPEFVTKENKRPDTADSIIDIFKAGIATLPVIQLGGNASLGKGLLRTKFINPNNDENHGG
jgi:CRISPR-associated protein Cmr4